MPALYALDSTTIDLCLSLFSWARFRRRKAAISYTRCLTCMAISQRLSALQMSKTANVKMLDEIIPEPAPSM